MGYISGHIGCSGSSGGGGGGGLAITGWKTDVFTQNSNFTAGTLVLTLSSTPLSAQAITVDYNGQIKLYNVDWTYAAGAITIQFADPDVTTYDAPPVFQIQYPY